MENGDPTDLEEETFALCSDQVGQIAVGGVEKKVILHKVRSENGTYNLDSGSEELAMCFDTPVTNLEYYAGGKLLGIAQDSHVQMMDIETKKVTSFV